MKTLIILLYLNQIFCNTLCRKKYQNDEDCEVRYPKLGKFTTAYPWSYVKRNPKQPFSDFANVESRPACRMDSPGTINTKFLIFNRANNFSITDPMEFDPMEDASTLNASGYLKHAKTLFFVHGWTASSTVNDTSDEPTLQLRLLVQEVQAMQVDINLIFVDWTNGAKYLRYWLAATNCEVVGRQIGYFIKSAIDEDLNNIDDFHVAGHSLGAHIAGYAGKFIQREMPGTILPRITGT